MNERKMAVIALVISLVVGGIALVRPAKTIIQQVSNGQAPSVGALASPALGPWYSIGDIEHYGASEDLLQATSTEVYCALQSPPFNSRFIYGGFNQTNATSTARIVTFATSTSPSATTTRIGNTATIAANWGTEGLFASTTMQDKPIVMATSTWFVIGVENNAASANCGTGKHCAWPTGRCQAEWVRNVY